MAGSVQTNMAKFLNFADPTNFSILVCIKISKLKAAGLKPQFRKLSGENADERLGDLMGIICCARASKGSARGCCFLQF